MRNAFRFTSRGKRIFFPLLLLAFGNTLLSVVLAKSFGGDVIDGYARDGHYYLADGTILNEISPAVWFALYAQKISVVVAFFVLIMVGNKLQKQGDLPPKRDDL